MPGEPLMCVWEAAYSIDKNSKEKQSLRTILRGLSLKFATLEDASIHATGHNFDEKHPGSDLTFEEYRNCVQNNLFDGNQSFTHFIESIERICWEECRDCYGKTRMKKLYGTCDVIEKLWQIFNRMTVVGSFPPVILRADVEWLITSMERPAINIDHENYTFGQFLENFTNWAFKGCSLSDIEKAIENCHMWLVREVTQMGWLYKRTKKRSNWTNWNKRWFQLSADGLTYYESPVCKPKERKGRITVNRRSIVSDVMMVSGVFHKSSKRYRMKVSNLPYIQLEVASNHVDNIKKWADALRDVTVAAEQGTTAVTLLLKSRSLASEEGKTARNELRKRAKTAKLLKQQSVDETLKMNSPKPANGNSKTSDRISGSSFDSNGTSCSGNSSDEEFDNDMFSAQKQKLKGVFAKIDANGDGYIDYAEFKQFVEQCGLDIEEKNLKLVFKCIDSNGNNKIDFEELNDYFIYVVMNDEMGQCPAQTSLRRAFAKADNADQDSVDFREFAEIARSRKQSIRVSKLMHAFDSMEKSDGGGVKFTDVRKHIFCEDDNANKARLALTKTKADQGLNKYLKQVYEDTDMEELATYIRKRWDKFASFRRSGGSGNTVMQGGHGMVDDIVPGNYSLVDLACYTDLPPIEPQHLVVPGIKWLSNKQGTGSGKLIFPATFSGKLPTEIATTQTLRYYGCSLADDNQVKISLLYRHGIQDFTYENKYLEDYVMSEDKLNGAGLEMHEFSHLDCPLENDSGHFIIGKIVDETFLHLTAFVVPTRHTVYVPPNCIHSNDYLKGTWRTMLSDEADIDHVQLMKPVPGKDGQLEKFIFKF